MNKLEIESKIDFKYWMTLETCWIHYHSLNYRLVKLIILQLTWSKINLILERKKNFHVNYKTTANCFKALADAMDFEWTKMNVIQTKT